MPLFARSFLLARPDQNELRSPTVGNGSAGPFTRTAGFLSYFEVKLRVPLPVIRCLICCSARFVCCKRMRNGKSASSPTGPSPNTCSRIENGSRTNRSRTFANARRTSWPITSEACSSGLVSAPNLSSCLAKSVLVQSTWTISTAPSATMAPILTYAIP